MRISDWSSDVCSSDLRHHLRSHHRLDAAAQPRNARTAHEPRGRKCAEGLHISARPSQGRGTRLSGVHRRSASEGYFRPPLHRSEEHTSELQSLMRISYAVFCLKKKKSIYRVNTH